LPNGVNRLRSILRSFLCARAGGAWWYDFRMSDRLFLMGVLLCAAATVQAQQYRWLDEKGRPQYGDNPPASAKGVRKNETRTQTPAEDAQQVPFELQQAQKDFPVTLFTAPICKQPCEQVRAWLNKRGVPFTEVQVWTPESVEQLKSKTGSDNVPALVVGRSALTGFDQPRFDGMLDSAGYPKAGVAPARAQTAPAPPEGYLAPPVAEPLHSEAEAPAKPGPYDTSKLPSNRSGKPGPYDPSGLKSNRSDKPGPYLAPGSTK
jgi:glutaredoxin